MRSLASLALALLACLVAGCRVTAAREVALPTEGPSYRVECNYEFANCLSYAKQQCDGRFEQITRKNCPRCGRTVPAYPEVNQGVQRPGYRGTLHFRCM